MKKFILGLGVAVIVVYGGQEYSGIGVVVLEPTDRAPPKISRVYKGFPADRAGMRAPLYLIALNGTNVVNWNGRQVAEVLRGAVGTLVNVTVSDVERTGTNTFRLIRVPIILPVE